MKNKNREAARWPRAGRSLKNQHNYTLFESYDDQTKLKTKTLLCCLKIFIVKSHIKHNKRKDF